MSHRHLSALIVLTLLGGCATSPKSTPSQTTTHPVMPTMTAMPAPASPATKPAPPTTHAMPMPAAAATKPVQPEILTPAPTPVATATPVKSKPRVPKSEIRSKAASRTASATRVKHERAASHDHVAPPVSKPHASPGQKIQGRIVIAATAGQTTSAADMTDTLVYFVPRSMKAQPKPGHYTIYTDHHQFDPGAMAVPAGSTISFVNLDSVDHNVFSVTPGNQFNLGYQSHGQSIAHTFKHPGLVLISCNVHPAMEVDLLVEPSPYVTRVDANGRFTLRGVPAGPGTLYAWNPRSRIVSQALDLPHAAPVQIHLTLTRAHIKTSLNVERQP